MKEARFISRNKDKWKNMENGQQPDAEHLAANFINCPMIWLMPVLFIREARWNAT